MKHYAALTAIIAGIAAAYFALVRAQDRAVTQTPAANFVALPPRIAGYVQSGEDIDVGDDVRAYLETSHILVRRYAAPAGRPIDVSIVHAAVTRRSLHFPEVCLVGEGWDIRDQSGHPVGVIFQARRLLLVRGGERQAVLYWFQTGTRLTGNYFANAWHWARDQVCFRSPVSAMIRISTPVGAEPEQLAFSALTDFAMKLAPIMQEYANRPRNLTRKRTHINRAG